MLRLYREESMMGTHRNKKGGSQPPLFYLIIPQLFGNRKAIFRRMNQARRGIDFGTTSLPPGNVFLIHLVVAQAIV